MYAVNKHLRGNWSDTDPVLSLERSASTVTVPVSAGGTMSSAVEDARTAVRPHSPCHKMFRASDKIDDVINDDPVF